MSEWEQYEAGTDSYIPVERWGHDHWSTLAYLETRAVDAKGIIDNRRMRCNPRLHRPFAHSADGSGYPTRLKDGEQDRHDDWSCLEDAVAAGLVIAWWRRVSSDLFGNSQARVELTEEGKVAAEQLRQHKIDGGNFSAFVLVGTAACAAGVEKR